MGQVQQLGASLEQTIAQYQYAAYRLQRIRRNLRENSHELRIAKQNLRRGERAIAQRLVTLYTADQISTLEVILGARSLDDLNCLTCRRIETSRLVTVFSVSMRLIMSSRLRAPRITSSVEI